MAHTVTLKGGPLDGHRLTMHGGKLIVPIIRDKADGECRIEQGTYEVQLDPAQAKVMIAMFYAG